MPKLVSHVFMIIDLVGDSWSISSAVVKGQRDHLIRFWLSCPEDSLDGLWSSPAGDATREMIAQLSPTSYFTDHQIALRNRIGEFLRGGFQQPGAVNAVLATFLLSPPGQFRIVNPESHLPLWLVPAYKALYEQGEISNASLNTQPSEQSSPHINSEVASVPSPNFGDFPDSLSSLLDNRLQLNRLLGLSNLFYIDPEDNEIKEELLKLRLNLCYLLLNSPDSALESAFASDFGDRFWSLVRSGIQNVPLDVDAEKLKQLAKDKLNPSLGGGFGTPGAIAAFLVSMTLYSPGSMQVENADQKLPSWLLPAYKDIFASALKS